MPRTRVQEVPGREPGVRVFVAHSEEREAYERELRELSRERVRKELEGLQARVEQGELKAAEKIGAAAARILGRHHGGRYFAWELRQGKFHYFPHPVHLPREQALEGKYVLQTEEPHLSPVEAIVAYKQLHDVERGFAHLKGLLEVRPVYHRWEPRVRAHVFVRRWPSCWTGHWRRNCGQREARFLRRRLGEPWKPYAVWRWSWGRIGSCASVGVVPRRPRC